uniref:DUF4209 domain-containing protein n=1 Tax=Clastoptera arizonana TaxID=38151 RepID=A0A1B6CY71_9HEMI
MYHLKKKSFLSQYVYHILVELAEEKEILTKENFVEHHDLTFNWNEIKYLFKDLNDSFKILEQPESWYIDKLKLVWKILHNAGRNLSQADEETLKRFWQLCEYTCHQEELIFCFGLLKENNSTNSVKISLKLTAILERTLGNIFLLEGGNVPFLLRDLLNTQEIRQILGKIPVMFIQLLVGTPKGLNLRNIVWHGFISPDELNHNLIYSLFVLFASLGKLITKQVFPVRPLQVNFCEYDKLLETTFPDLRNHYEAAVDILENCKLIPDHHLHFWKESLFLYKQKSFIGMEIL